MPTPAHSIHILGLGSIGTFIAHSLRSLSTPPPVTLLAHRKGLYDEIASNGWKLGLRVGENGTLDQREGFEAELLSESTSSDHIHNLIVAVKASATVSALEPIRHRIGPQSTVCLFQNGLGQIEDLNQRVFVDPSTRPTYMFGIMRHGVYLRSPVEAILSGTSGTAALGIVDSQKKSAQQPQSQYILDTLLQSTALHCEKMEWPDLFRVQLLKLASNCVLNPLTALLDVRNGCIKDNIDLQPLQRRLLEEISAVFQKLPEMQELSLNRDQFSTDSLESVLRDTIEKTAQNSSSMREDILKRRSTEIQYINGWIVRRARAMGIDCEANSSITQLVLAKSGFTMTGN
ncbi:hypothetical protein N7532_007952 [Penicillium argentinense]|uniref:2-dehydropantoate 2-reductase n=1 Tax=Penicillium argentinense TaxID=1131581 RepID=A0A9W9EWE6_9EURO|nr:uncharacterized protein N7532_007952 [Penicillium argentinense]KAJ5089268.1 hypothetical protein N7532_007952 [Penicillium argentinense]